MKIIVVGNAASLLAKTNGTIIDTFDKVIRLNKFKTQSYEKYVGSKTDIYCSKWLNMADNVNMLSTIKTLWLPYPKPPHWWTSKGNFFEQTREESENLALKYDIIPVYLTSEGATDLNSFFKTCHPSTGLICLKIATEQFPNEEIFYTGFDAFSTGWYWDPKRDCTVNMKNSILFEKIFLNRLKTNYAIKEL